MAEPFLKRLLKHIPFIENRETPLYSFTQLFGFRYHRVGDPKILAGLVTDHTHFSGPAFQRALTGEVIGNALINSEGESWEKQRKLFKGFFSPRAIEKNLSPLIADESRSMTDRWLADGKPVDVEREMRELIGRVTIAAIFGDSITGRETHDIIEAVSNATIQSFRGLTGAGIALRATGLHRVPGLEFLGQYGGHMPDYYKSEEYRQTKEGVDSIIYNIIAERRKLARQPNDLLGLMIDPPVDIKSGERIIDPMTDQEIRDQAIMFIVAGHDTTSVGVTFTLLEVLKHPEKLAEIRAEIDSNIGSRPVQPGDFHSLPSLQKAFKEAVRLHPPSHSMGREVTADIEIEGVQFKKGDVIRIDIPSALSDGATWENPHDFYPGRMPEGFKIDQNYIAFGRGPRTCLGMSLANIEATLALATIFQQASLTILQEPDGEDHSGFSTRIEGKAVCAVEPRQPATSDAAQPAMPPKPSQPPGSGGCPFHHG